MFFLTSSQIWLNLPMDDCHFWLHHKMDQKLNTFPMWKHTPLLFVPMTKEGCIFFCFGMDLLGPHYDQSDQIIELWDKLQFSFSPFKANTNLRTKHREPK
jgi:hypothetical protein